MTQQIYPKLNFHFEVGKRQNVRLSYTDIYGEMIREITSVKWHKEKGELWFSWYWRPEMGADLVGSMDCGFAGMCILNANGEPSKYHAHFIDQNQLA